MLGDIHTLHGYFWEVNYPKVSGLKNNHFLLGFNSVG